MRIRVIDAFTDRPFAGNPAAVCLLDGDSWPDETWMRSLAKEMRHSETAFTLRLQEGGEADFALRWFTPAEEVNLCGHATLATAHALHTDRGAPGTVRFSSRSGVLVAHSRADGSITLDFPVATLSETAVPDGLVEALGAKPDAAFSTGKLGDLLTVFSDEPAVRGIAPDFAALTKVIDDNGYRGVIATGPPSDPGAGYDFVSRFFAPSQDINEDPVTGSAHTALAPYWTDRLGRNGLIGLQASARTGLVATELHGDRVHLTGRAITVLDATLHAVP
jgi:PhzF family phenazine biosynthesis protein